MMMTCTVGNRYNFREFSFWYEWQRFRWFYMGRVRFGGSHTDTKPHPKKAII